MITLSLVDIIVILIIVIGLYYTHYNLGIGKRKRKDIKRTILEALNEWDRSNDQY